MAIVQCEGGAFVITTYIFMYWSAIQCRLVRMSFFYSNNCGSVMRLIFISNCSASTLPISPNWNRFTKSCAWIRLLFVRFLSSSDRCPLKTIRSQFIYPVPRSSNKELPSANGSNQTQIYLICDMSRLFSSWMDGGTYLLCSYIL